MHVCYVYAHVYVCGNRKKNKRDGSYTPISQDGINILCVSTHLSLPANGIFKHVPNRYIYFLKQESAMCKLLSPSFEIYVCCFLKANFIKWFQGTLEKNFQSAF